MPPHLYRPSHAKLKHGRGVWSGPFYPSAIPSRDLNEHYRAIRKKLDPDEFAVLCKKVHGYDEAVKHEVTSDGYVNDLIVWVEVDDEGVIGVLFPALDEHGKQTREIGFYVRGPGQAAIDGMANTFSSMFAAAMTRKK